ncbi:uncharacterized protein LOC143020133, partial [Oratosquilla oratoria]|uniref:uncharacterized protein LOC143020133 n=1 Tax=Oratosquilla oratoria TaxID=337810 RepID=UPI003F75B0DE
MKLLNSVSTTLTLLVVTVLCSLQQGNAVCYFPGELQGKWKTQQSTSTRGHHGRGVRAPLEYSTVTIEADIIQEWGVCHTRVGNNVILADRSGGSGCMRCFHLSVVSPNVMQVFTESLDTCYTNQQAALDTCPTPPRIARRLTNQQAALDTCPTPPRIARRLT